MTKAEAIKQLKEVKAYFLSRAKNRSEKYDIQVAFDDLIGSLED